MAYDKESYLKNKEKILDRQREYRRTHKKKMMANIMPYNEVLQ